MTSYIQGAVLGIVGSERIRPRSYCVYRIYLMDLTKSKRKKQMIILQEEIY